MRRLMLTLGICIAAFQTASAQLPRLAANDNRAPAGVLNAGVLQLKLQITKGMWHPDGENDAGVDVIALGEVGKTASVPAPLIRVPKGTIVRATVTNTLDESMIVFGLGPKHSLADSVRLQPHETRLFEATADEPGNYYYAAWRNFRVASPENPAAGNDMTAGGAFIVDEPGTHPKDRVFVINMMVDTMRVPRMPGLTSILATMNGKSWPHNERITQNVGDTIVWRVINASIIPHPMHLHGFYFDVLAHGAAGVDTIYDARAVRKAVTERLTPGTTMTMRWIPDRAGNWLFHCHLTAHTQLHGPVAGALKASGNETHVHDAIHGMSNLLLGITVRGPVARDVDSRRGLRLAVNQLDSLHFKYVLDGKPNPVANGPTIVINKGEPTAINVVNLMTSPTAVHWHGIELESYNDGVAGFGGHTTRISPLIAAGDSFVARMTPPRAGTFIYHTHIDELRQQRGGLYGALLVVDPKTYDPAYERVIVLGSPVNVDDNVLLNGEEHPDLQMEVGKTYRLRFVQIMTGRPGMYVALVDPSGAIDQWQAVAKDGADLPAHQAGMRPARQSLSNGETYDALFTPKAAGTWKLETRAGNGLVFGYMTITAR
jgi:manganese oxidase